MKGNREHGERDREEKKRGEGGKLYVVREFAIHSEHETANSIYV